MGAYGNSCNFDGTIEDVVHAALEFGQRMRDMGRDISRETKACGFDQRFEEAFGRGPGSRRFHSNFYFYPPANIYESRDGSLVLEFALSGIGESDVSVEFKGDYLVLSAKAVPGDGEREAEDCYRRGFRPRNIERQKYYVPADEYVQEEAKASFKNGMLTVVVPSKESAAEGIEVKIIKEGA